VSFARPEALLVLLVLPWLYFLHRTLSRLHAVSVPSLLLFECVPWRDDTRGRRRVDLLRFLPLAVAWSLLAAALAEPSVGGAEGRTMFVVLDRSASMKAGPRGGPRRFDEARARADLAIARLAPSDRVVLRTLPPLEAFPPLEPRAARERLLSLRPADLPSDVGRDLPAILAEARVEEAESFFLVSDRVSTDGLGPEPFAFEATRVGSPVENLGIVAFDVLDAGEGEELYTAVVRSTGEEAVDLPVSLRVDGVERARAEVRVPPAGAVLVRLRGPEGEVAEVRLEIRDDLAADDAVAAVHGPRERVRVIVAGRPDAHIVKALRVQPEVELRFGGRLDEADLWIGCGVLPEGAGGADRVCIDPPGDPAPFRLLESYTPAAVRALPVAGMDGVSLAGVTVARARRVASPPGATILAVAEGPEGEIPLLVRWGATLVVPFSLDSAVTNWPLYFPGFPIFWKHIVSGAASRIPLGMECRRTADGLDLTGPGRLVGPEGAVVEVPSGSTRHVLPERVGVWRWEGATGAVERFAFGLLSEGETQCPLEGGEVRRPAVRPDGSSRSTGTPLARVLVAAGAVSLGIFWGIGRVRPRAHGSARVG